MSLSSKLSRLRVTNAGFVPGGKKGEVKVEVYLEGSDVMPAQLVQVVTHEPWVASWWKTRYTNKVLVDDDAATEEKYILSLAVHETIEKWLYETFFKHHPIRKAYPICHRTAQNIERNFHKRKWGKRSWEEYSKVVEKAYRHESKYWESKQEGKQEGKQG